MPKCSVVALQHLGDEEANVQISKHMPGSTGQGKWPTPTSTSSAQTPTALNGAEKQTGTKATHPQEHSARRFSPYLPACRHYPSNDASVSSKPTSSTLEHASILAAERRQRLLGRLTLTIGLIFLVGPLWLLNMLSTEHARLTAISVLVSCFVGLLGLGTNVRPSESLGAGAAYAAVLLVFVQLGAGPKASLKPDG